MASEDAVVAQGLQCFLCYDLFTEPKLLACAHTFCKKCVAHVYECHPEQNKLSCPICHQITSINNGDMSKLQTNVLINATVNDVKAATKICNICDTEAAVKYCVQCEEFMCDSCTVAHGKFKKNAKHDLVSLDDIEKGKFNAERFCTKHPGEEKLYACTSCSVSICFNCRVTDHAEPNHKIQDVSDYMKTIQEKIKSLQIKATTKIEKIESLKELKNERKAVFEVELDQRIAEIDQSYEKAVHHLTRQRNDLIDRCKQAKTSYIAQLEKNKKGHDKEINRIKTASELVGNGVKTLLEGQALAVHNTICCDLEKMLEESNHDANRQSKSTADIAKQSKFLKSGTTNSLGDLILPDWQLDKVNIFQLSHYDPCDAIPLADGRVAIGYNDGEAIEMLTTDGRQETVMRNMTVYHLCVLSDGRYVVRDYYNHLTLYNRAWNSAPNDHFNTLSQDDGGWGGMCVDSDDNIYFGYDNQEEIDVFKPVGSLPFRKIKCNGYAPWEICHMNYSKEMVMCDCSWSVRVIDDMDEKGTVLHQIQVDSKNTHIAVLKDDTILIARTKDGLMNIELYTKDLKKIRTVIRDVPQTEYISKMLELPTGEVAVVSATKLTFFHKIYT